MPHTPTTPPAALRTAADLLERAHDDKSLSADERRRLVLEALELVRRVEASTAQAMFPDVEAIGASLRRPR
jgi:hypothetical protein